MNSKFIGSQQTHRKSLHQIDLQETIVLRIIREREREEAIQLLPTDPQVYGGLLTHHRRGTYEEDEPLRDGVQIGSRCSGTCGGWNCVSLTPLGFLEYLGIYRHQRRCGGAPWKAQPIRACRGPPGVPWWVVLSTAHLPGSSLDHQVSSSPEKISKKFRRDWTPFGIDFLRSKKTSKNNNWHFGTMSIGQSQKMI